MGMLGMIFGLAFIYGFSNYFKKLWIHVLFIGIIGLSMVQIQIKHTFFEERLLSFERTFEMNKPYQKLYIPMKKFNWGKIWYPYQVPVESLMYSSLYNKNNSKTILIELSNEGIDSTILTRKKFLNIEKLEKNLNKKYFNLPEVGYHLTEQVGWE